MNSVYINFLFIYVTAFSTERAVDLQNVVAAI